MAPTTVTIAGIPITVCTRQEAVGRMLSFIQGLRPHYVVTVNPEFIVASHTNARFRDVLSRASLALADGVGILWVARFFHCIDRATPRRYRPWMAKAMVLWWWLKSLAEIVLSPSRTRSIIPERVSGVDTVELLCAHLGPDDTLYLLGARPGIAKNATELLRARYPNLTIVGAEEGLRALRIKGDNLVVDEEESREFLERIRTKHPRVLLVAFGHVKQELWIERFLFELPSVRLAIGVGGTLDFIVGVQKRSPRLLQWMGLEWLWRLMVEPQRIVRMWRATIKFPLLMYRQGLEHFRIAQGL